MPDRRVRPSLLTPISKLFSAASVAASTILGKDKTDLFLFAVEKGIQVTLLFFKPDRMRMTNNYGF